ncbi:autotransporter assembly complex protein TamA [Vibrio maerlii]|uniref:autotransporter assembly complex protein TamA n=1 Tax=Vibrio maerlii TaxID=2231648 RepID=UPI000E3BE5E6|nr:autotransporter assembly complex family protein [Vibrio maerlii]
MIRRTFTLIVAGSLLLPTLSAQAKTSLDIEGLDGALEDNVEVYINAISEDEYSTSLRFQSRLRSTINEALNALGYYHPEISFEVSEGEDELVVNVNPGEPVRINEIDVQLIGGAKEDESFASLIERSLLKTGEPINHSLYDGLKSSLRNLGLQRGYFEAAYDLSRLEIIPETNQANIRLHYNSGPRYHFGATSITGSQIDEERVDSLQPYDEGDAYLVSKVGEHNQNLSNTDWFSSVLVEPDLSSLGNGNTVVPMRVSLAPQARNQLETGLGVSTDVGVRGSLKWKKPWINSAGHSFNSSLSISKPEQSITASYKIPLEDVLRDYYQVQYGMKNVDNLDTKSLESNLALERHWELDSGWHRTIFIRYLIENYEQGIQDEVGQMVMPGISFSKTRTRGTTMPMWGDKKSITVEVGSEDSWSETNVVRVLGSTAWIRGIGNNHRGIFKLDAGANFVGDFTRLPPSLRFFAGGDNSIRGYSYESISPRDESGARSGGQYLATSTLEYQYRVYGNWWGAVFYDYGDAFNETPEWKSGTGVGVRWASPVGPVALDFAFGLDEEKGDQFQFHFSLGPEL